MKFPGKKTLALALGLSAAIGAQAEGGSVSIPIEGPLEMRKTENGTTVLISSDGRFVMPARLIDRENGNEMIESLSEAREAYGDGGKQSSESQSEADKVSLKDYDPEELATFTIGEGDKDVFVWFDPTCPHCETVLSMQPDLAEEYTFHNILFPALGPNAERLTEQMVCLGEDEMRKAAMAKKQNVEVEDESQCRDEELANNMKLAQANGIRSVPVVVTSDGRSRTGAFRTKAAMKAFLEGEGQ